jgi:hypothetical protein
MYILKKRFYLLFCIICFQSLANAQTFEQIHPTFIQNGTIVKEATVGGLSAPQFSEVDLNNDGILDLYVFDKIDQIGLTFLNGGSPNQVDYTYAPIYQNNFPILNEWVLLRDYNGDGIQDIFAYSSIPGVPGIEVYTGYYDDNDRIAFQKNNLSGGQFNILYYPGNNGNNNLYVSNIDYPAIDDIDMDGDLDILTFNIAGGVIEYFSNQSVERGFGKDSLIYKLEDNCWGKFYESGITKEVDLSDNEDQCALSLVRTEPRSGLHAGSTLLTFDMDNDGDKEVVLGDISFTNLNLVVNGGNASKAFMTSQDVAFPKNTESVDLPLFPAAFLLDVNNDGIRDLVAAPNLGNDIGETYEAAWYYQNTATNEEPVFELQQKNLLVENMLDFGTGAQPVFVDWNQDGLLDLVIGNKSYFVPGGMRNATVFLYENTGTATAPIYTLKEENLWNLNAFSQNAWRFTPTFGDLDGDGDLDALIGEEFGNLFYAENIAGPNQPFEFKAPVFAFQDIDVGQVNRPQLIDMNRDGLLDLVIGERNGNLNYFENTGTAQNPVFGSSPTNNFFGKVDARGKSQVTGYSAPTIIELDGVYELFVGNEEGKILRYNNVEGNLAGTFARTDENFGNLTLGTEIHPAFADIDNDGLLEMAIGHFRGGLTFYKTNLKSDITSVNDLTESVALSIYPNPVTNLLSLQLEENIQPTTIKIYNAVGQLMLVQPFQREVDVKTLNKGVFLLEIISEEGVISRKFVKE